MIRRIAAFLLTLLLLSALALPAIATPADNGDTLVYVTETGQKYHRKSCGYLNRSCYEITLREAAQSGYSPCSRCSPPRYNGTIENSSRSLDRSQSSRNRSSSSGSISSKASSAVKKNSSFPLGIVIMLALLIVIPGGLYLWTIISEKISDFKDRKSKPVNDLLVYHKQLAASDAQNQQRDQMLAEIKKMRIALSAQVQSLVPLAARNANAATDLSHIIDCLNQDLDAELKKHDASFDRGRLTTNDGPAYGDSCTVFFSQKSSCYHYRWCSRNPGIYHSHILSPPFGKKPCSYCHPYPPLWMGKCSELHKKIENLEQLKISLEGLDPDFVSQISERCAHLQAASAVFDYGTNNISFT